MNWKNLIDNMSPEEFRDLSIAVSDKHRSNTLEKIKTYPELNADEKDKCCEGFSFEALKMYRARMGEGKCSVAEAKAMIDAYNLIRNGYPIY